MVSQHEENPVDPWLTDPITSFLGRQATSGLVLFVAALPALIVANSPLADAYHHLWHNELPAGVNDFIISETLHHGLMMA